VEQRPKSQDFQGGDATSLLGGCKIDLRQAAIKREEAILDVFALWGGIEVIVPRNWSVVIQGTPILGAFADKTDSSKEEGGPRLIIRGAVIMGGVEIKN
jgi:predicted membrane protein